MRHKKKIKAVLYIALGISVIGISTGCSLTPGDRKYSKSKLQLLNKYLEKSYLGEMEEEQIINSMYSGYVEGLENAVTMYLDEDQLKLHEAIEIGKSIGTGLSYQWSIDGDYLIVTEIIKDSPAQKAGIKVGDKIVQIEDTKVIPANQGTIQEKLTYVGEEEILYKVEDNDGTNLREVTLKVAELDIESLNYEIIDEVGYVQLNAVKEGTAKALEEAIKSLQAKNVKGIVLDIREIYSNNIDEVYKLANLFLDEKLAFKVKDKAGTMKEYMTEPGAIDTKVVAIIDENTRGMMEALAAALKGNVTLIGTTTGASGQLSQIFSLGDGTGLRVAIGTLYTAQDLSLIEEGIVPDIEVSNTIESTIELLTKGQISKENDNQLMKAIDEFQ